MQAENQKLKKDVADKLKKVQIMEDKLEETTKECRKLVEMTGIYADLMGIHIDPVFGKEKEFVFSVYESSAKTKKLFEARMETISQLRDRTEWQVTLNKLPLLSFMGYQEGNKLIYQESNIANFYDMVKEAANFAN